MKNIHNHKKIKKNFFNNKKTIIAVIKSPYRSIMDDENQQVIADNIDDVEVGITGDVVVVSDGIKNKNARKINMIKNI